jgi:putative protein-disulfide isomerase
LIHCDPTLGACTLPGTDDRQTLPSPPLKTTLAIHYFGDPMCSWCWGISPATAALARFCHDEGIAFRMTMGGLRAGGGDPWNAPFKAFLRREWEHISQATGQPFSYRLLQRTAFNYDTEPACRAVASIRVMLEQTGRDPALQLSFFAAVQERFYVEGDDPATVAFYREPCAIVEVDFQEFSQLWESIQARLAVAEDFGRCRKWGVSSFPTLAVEKEGRLSALAVGHIGAQELVSRARQILQLA